MIWGFVLSILEKLSPFYKFANAKVEMVITLDSDNEAKQISHTVHHRLKKVCTPKQLKEFEAEYMQPNKIYLSGKLFHSKELKSTKSKNQLKFW